MKYPNTPDPFFKGNGLASDDGASPSKGPETKRVDVNDTLHQVALTDPYRWLEDTESEEVQHWVDQQNQATSQYLEAHASHIRSALVKRFRELTDFTKRTLPKVRGNKHFNLIRLADAEQHVLVEEDGDGFTILMDPVKLLGPNTQVFDYEPSPDGKQVALQWATAGSDRRHVGIFSVRTGKLVYTAPHQVRFSNLAWLNDALYYLLWDANRQHIQCVSTSGSEWVVKTLATFDNCPWHYGNVHPDGGGRVFVETFYGTRGNQLWSWSIDEGWRCWIEEVEGFAEWVGLREGSVFVRTNKGEGKNFYLLSISTADTSQRKMILPELSSSVLEQIVPLQNGFAACYQEQARHNLVYFDWQGQIGRPILLPPNRAIAGISIVPHTDTFYLSLTSFNHPEWLYFYQDLKLQPIYTPKLPRPKCTITVGQSYFESFDQTPISLFIIHKEGLDLQQPKPCYLYGYGGFGLSMLPSLRLGWVPFIESGGIVVVANIRGGSEQGRQWHDAGKKNNKHTVFNDFIAAGEFLIQAGYTTSQQLILGGRSNGGLLVGTVMTQRPDLAAIAIPGSGLLDMIRYQQFTIGHFWEDEYGSIERAEEFHNLLSFSPYHNVKEGVEYPATIITAAEKDDRVSPAHSYKFAAILQHHQAGQNPILLRVDKNAGHAKGKTYSQMIEEQADIWSFAFARLGMNLI